MSFSNVFTYGTLCLPEVMQLVTGKTFQMNHARLEGFKCNLVRNKIYPGIVEAKESSVTGIVHFDVDQSSLNLLDCFEDIIYQRQLVNVVLEDNKLVEAFVYVLKQDEKYCLSQEPWDEYHFRSHQLENYLRRIQGII